ncbi:protease FtsH-inhibitory lysogeny factor CIII [Atlantibacter hermannii]|uniref:protease FtsH-inhibitory lysogeny factor CIII n=1 Tax=Atlantibacter hermannii TaxID=565 RepID=UPI00115F6F55|nr:protease FtsH-inhibitory lysogeny factor CIII [Atlantibacter hermannii]
MMHLQLAGSGVMSAFYPPESELHRKVRQLIRAAMLRLKDTLSQPGVPAHDHFTR